MLPRHLVQKLRTFGIVAHVDAGKTTLTERILHATGRIHVAGAVDDGNTVTDSDPREQAHGITIGAAAVTASHRGHVLCLVDTPGHVDFGVEVERSLRVLDGAIVVLDAVAGVEPQTESAWARADKHQLPRIVFVNKLDRVGADFDRSVRSLEEVLGAKVLALVVPAPDGRSLIDLVQWCAIEAGERSCDRIRPLDPESARFARPLRERVIEACASADDGVLRAFVDGGDVTAAALLAVLRSATIARAIVPIVSGSAKVGLGVSTLLDHVVALLPSPIDRGAVLTESGGAFEPDPRAPLVAFCFKSVHDGHGQRTFVRVYAGTLAKGAHVLAVRSGKRFRVGRLARLFGGGVEDVDAAGPGEIVAILGVPLDTGETLSDPARPALLEALTVPAPVVGVAIEPRTSEGRSRLGSALRRIIADDPSLTLSGDPDTGETILAGLGELHLDVTLEKLRDVHGVDVRSSDSRVAYRETIRTSSESEVKHIKRTGGPGQYAHVRLRVEPAGRGEGLSFVDLSEGGAIPRAYIPAVEAGAREAAAFGVLAGYPVVDVVVTLLGGSSHSHDSSELAFAIAGRRAFSEAARAASPVLLEPVMRLEVAVPEPCLGDVMGDLAARRGRVTDLGTRGAQRTVSACAPLAGLLGYVTALRSRTQGRGSASMTLAGYEIVSAGVTERVLHRT